MNVLRMIAVSFSLYSKIPMPVFDWNDKDMKYNLIFFPWIGMLIAGIIYGAYLGLTALAAPCIVMILFIGVIPIIITGGFHIDGYMDVSDARNSYAGKDKKLEILKDPHIGAFAVINLIKIVLIYGAAVGIIIDRGDSVSIILLGLTYVLSRCLSGISARLLRKARKEGMLYEETKGNGHLVEILLAIQMLIVILVMIFINPLSSLVILVFLTLAFIYYKLIAYKEFGGVTGDTAGYFVVISETMMAIALAISLYI